MSKLYLYILTKICEKIIYSSYHKNNLILFYATMHKIARNRFTEDTVPGLDAYMTEQFIVGMKQANQSDQ